MHLHRSRRRSPKGDKGTPRADAVAEAEESEEDDGSEGYHRSMRVTAHVKSANRLCCALTRGRSCVVVVYQLAVLSSTDKGKGKGKCKGKGKKMETVEETESEKTEEGGKETEVPVDVDRRSWKRVST